MVRLGLDVNYEENDEFENACLAAAETVKIEFSGKGILNAYFREALNWVK